MDVIIKIYKIEDKIPVLDKEEPCSLVSLYTRMEQLGDLGYDCYFVEHNVVVACPKDKIF